MGMRGVLAQSAGVARAFCGGGMTGGMRMESGCGQMFIQSFHWDMLSLRSETIEAIWSVGSCMCEHASMTEEVPSVGLRAQISLKSTPTCPYQLYDLGSFPILPGTGPQGAPTLSCWLCEVNMERAQISIVSIQCVKPAQQQLSSSS